MGLHANGLRRSTWLLIVLCLLLALAADWLFYGWTLGWTAALFGVALLLAVLLRGWRFPGSWPGRLLSVAMLGLLLALLENPGPLPLLLGALAIVTLAVGKRGRLQDDSVAWLCRWSSFFVKGWSRPLLDLYISLRAKVRQGPRPSRFWQMVGLWLLPVLLSLVFVALFSLANPIFGLWFGRVRDAARGLLEFLFDGITFLRVVFWLAVATWSWALLRARSRRPAASEAALVAQLHPWQPKPGAIVRCLLLFNLVFAAQTALDVAFLWSGAALPAGVSYAQYAHRGAYPLLAAALLAAVFVLVAFRPGQNQADLRWARVLVYFWLAQNAFLVVSAALRLAKYVQAYDLTRWRVAAALWMALVVFGLLSIVWRLLTQRDNRWLLRVNAAVAALLLYACCFVSFDQQIALYNVRHCREITGGGQGVDLAYLQELGVDALPAVLWLEEHLQDGETSYQAYLLRERLSGDLDRQMDNWRGWTWRRQRIADVLAGNGHALVHDSR